MKRIGVLTGGGECPGLNALLRGIVIEATNRKLEIYGFQRGWKGLMNSGDYIPLEFEDVEEIGMLGPTILRTSRENPLASENAPKQILENLKRSGCEALIIIGDYDVLRTSRILAEKIDLKMVCIPKSVKNNVSGTEYNFGFFSSVNYATELIDRLHTTAHSAGRCLIIETSGQTVGWAALYSGQAGGAHAILIPEAPYDLDQICNLVDHRKKNGKEYTIIVSAEGSRPNDETDFKVDTFQDEFGNKMISGTGDWLADKIKNRGICDARSLSLYNMMRGGPPDISDRLMGLKFGSKSIELISEGKSDVMVSLKNSHYTYCNLEEAVQQPKRVPIELYEKTLRFLL